MLIFKILGAATLITWVIYVIKDINSFIQDYKINYTTNARSHYAKIANRIFNIHRKEGNGESNTTNNKIYYQLLNRIRNCDIKNPKERESIEKSLEDFYHKTTEGKKDQRNKKLSKIIHMGDGK